MEENKKDNKTENQESEIERLGAVAAPNALPEILTVSIIGQIEGHYILADNQKTTKYEHILPMLASAEQDRRIKGLLVIINTVGGDIEAGLAIAEMLAGMVKPSVSLILGGGHSIGIPIAVACKKSYAVPSSSMTIHPVRTSGTVLGVPQAFYSLEKMQERVSDFIVSHSGIKKDALSALMLNTSELTTDVGSVISGQDAVRLGIIDELGGISDAIAEIKRQISAVRRR